MMVLMLLNERYRNTEEIQKTSGKIILSEHDLIALNHKMRFYDKNRNIKVYNCLLEEARIMLYLEACEALIELYKECTFELLCKYMSSSDNNFDDYNMLDSNEIVFVKFFEVLEKEWKSIKYRAVYKATNRKTTTLYDAKMRKCWKNKEEVQKALEIAKLSVTKWLNKKFGQ